MPRKPDALLIPRSYRTGTNPAAQREALRKEFLPVLGGPFSYTVDGYAGMDFVRLPRGVNDFPTFFFPTGHPRQGEGRYDWWVAEKTDGQLSPTFPADDHPTDTGHVLVGYLKPDADADSPTVAQGIAEEFQRRKAEALKDSAVAARLREIENA